MFEQIKLQVKKILEEEVKKRPNSQARYSEKNDVFGARLKNKGKEVELFLISMNETAAIIHLSGGLCSSRDYRKEFNSFEDFENNLPEIKKFLTESLK